MSLVRIYNVGSGGGGGGGTAVMIAGAGTGSTLRCGAFNTASGDYSMAWGKCGIVQPQVVIIPPHREDAQPQVVIIPPHWGIFQ